MTKLESNTSQNRVHITYKIDTGSDGNLMLFKVFKMLFPKSKLAALYITIQSYYKTYNQSDMEQLGLCTG